jgi:site-specific recombinase, phage integrase family
MAKATKQKSGNWRCVASYTDENGAYKQKVFTAPSKKEAEFLASQFKLNYKHDNKTENKSVGKLIDEYITNNSNLLSPSTIRGYKTLKKTALQEIIDLPTHVLTHQLYQQAINNYAKTHKPKTVQNAHALFATVLKENKIYITEDTNLPQKEKKEISIPTKEELSSFLSYLKENHPDLYLLCTFSVYAGLRHSETIALTWGDINNRTISITKAKVRDADGQYQVKPPKTTAGTRKLEMPDKLYNALPPRGEDSESVITSNIKTLDNLYIRVSKKVGFNYNFHSLRHYYASILLLEGVPNKYAMERMGHATDNMLKNVYQHTFRSKQEEIDKTINAAFNKL